MEKEVIDNPRYPHHITIVRKLYDDWLDEPSSDSSTSSGENELKVYDGPGRSYTDTTTTGDARVDTNKRKCSIPMRYSDWILQNRISDGGPMIPMSGDLCRVTKGDISEEWEVRDFEPDNDRSVIYGELNRNLNNAV